jgi:uncharacterized linocin/CFP29 family protein
MARRASAKGKKGIPADTAMVSSGQSFMSGSSGRWAAERFLKAINEGKPLSASLLRTADTLRRDEWKHFDEVLIREGLTRLIGVADLLSAGLTMPIPNAMGKTLIQWEKVTDMEPAEVSLSGLDRTDDDRLEFEPDSTPLPITHKDFNINLRTLAASRERGEPLDTMQAEVAGRKVAEKLEEMLFRGGKKFLGKTIYGYTTHPNRNAVDFTATPWSNGSTTGDQMLADVQRMIAAAEADFFFGPYWLYIPTNSSLNLDKDFKANSDKTIRERLLNIDRLQQIKTADALTADNLVLIQPTRDVVVWANGEPLQTIQWDADGGFRIKFKAFAIQVPVIRATEEGRSGVVHMSDL